MGVKAVTTPLLTSPGLGNCCCHSLVKVFAEDAAGRSMRVAMICEFPGSTLIR
ncbi:hypothetical protein DSO57_1039313 [Entomophthora muscae]|uniref:Uncharacterized protein n=1 Tax=Entomophthora muscae TaxID=34485 RepID=A0ACC2RPD5_9FUNG|nr:hypothetical protein DSO57_1039313 [Entomophthora muscae]